jgi:cytochrome c
MPGHTHLPANQIEVMVDYILALANPNARQRKLPLFGAYLIDRVDLPEGYYILQASYEDKGANGIQPLKSTDQIILRNSLQRAAQADQLEGVAKANGQQFQFVRFTAPNAWIKFDQLDLSEIRAVELALNPGNTTGKIQLRWGSAEGELIGETPVLSKKNRPEGQKGQFFSVSVPVLTKNEGSDFYLVFVPEGEVSIWNTFNLNTIRFLK